MRDTSKDVWKPSPNNPGFEINQLGQLRGIDETKGKFIPPVYKEPAYKPFQGKEWPEEI